MQLTFASYSPRFSASDQPIHSVKQAERLFVKGKVPAETLEDAWTSHNNGELLLKEGVLRKVDRLTDDAMIFIDRSISNK